ncbi:MAG: hypothetical protein N2506_06900, partial [Dehalococcoidales bacterium]|nr:hypothetical protein [Dehalococcoidales bacterium]
EYLPPEVFLPAVGQGALGIEVRDGDRDAIGTVSVLNHLPTWRAITAERTFLRALGGGCRAPIAALGCVTGSVLELRGMVADASDGTILRASLVDDAENPEGVGLGLAQKMLEMGAGELIRRAGMR